MDWIAIENSNGTSLVAQWLRLHTPNAGGPGSIPGQGARSHMHAATKSSHATTKGAHVPQVRSQRAATKTECHQIKKKKKYIYIYIYIYIYKEP